MKTQTVENLTKIKENAVDQINNEFDEFTHIMSKYKDPAIHEFVDLFVLWYCDKDKNKWLYSLFSNVIDLGEKQVISSLGHFIDYQLYDDGGYSLWWEESKFDDETGTIQQIYHKEYVDNSYPVFKFETDDNYHKDVQLIIHTMRVKEKLENEWITEYYKSMNEDATC